MIAKIPAAARANDKSGGVAFSRFYFGTLNSAFKTGDSELLAALASPRCPTCMAFVDGVEQLNEQERRYGGDLVSVTSASALNFSTNNKQVLLEIDQKSVPVLNEVNDHVGTTPAGKASFIATLGFKAGRWSIERLQKVAS
ncbi:DUF6318 family protein [Terrabacter sp. Ter38]|uniref:DUF6318 family protein n=1 Tax=Terrabacter sp. Ter38 TaxID=2926030 RepID=UPI00211863B1|nr:DUF6318 family protein [Terrabacter sp. Ter38]